MSIENSPIDGSQPLSDTSSFYGIDEVFTSLKNTLLTKTERIFAGCVSTLTNFINPLSKPLPEAVQDKAVEICVSNIVSDEEDIYYVKTITEPVEVFTLNSQFLLMSYLLSRPEFLKILKVVTDPSFSSKKVLLDGTSKILTFCVAKVDLDALVKGQEVIDVIKNQSQKISKIARKTTINSIKSAIVTFEKGPFQVEDISLLLI